MRLECTNDELLNSIWGTYRILDSSVEKFDIYLQENRLFIDIYFTQVGLAHTKKIFKIHFSDVTRYQFSWTNDHNFYCVERYKFFKTGQGYYLSLDPVDESKEISNEDQDLILCETIEGYLL